MSVVPFRIYFGIVFPLNNQQKNKSDNTKELIRCVVEFNELLNEVFRVADEKLFLEVAI